MKFAIITILFSLFLLDFGFAQQGDLDISRFGGKPNTNIGQVSTCNIEQKKFISTFDKKK